MNRYMQYFVMVSDNAVQLDLEKMMNSIAINTYFFKKLFLFICFTGAERESVLKQYLYG